MLKKFYLLNLLVLLFGLTFSNLAVTTAYAAGSGDVYNPTVDDDEVSVFLETSCSNAKAWAWNAEFAQLTNNGWPGDAMTLMGKSESGKNIFKWTCAKGVLPTGIIFTHDGEQKFVQDNISYVNHGYYVDGVYKKTIERTGGEVMVYFDNTTANLSNVYCYIYLGNNAVAEWPGLQMTYDASATLNGKTGWYTVKVPEAFGTGYFVVNDGTGGTLLEGETVYVEENTATAIEATTITEVEKTADDNWYTLTGMRISKPSQPGIYIHNGKKIIIRK